MRGAQCTVRSSKPSGNSTRAVPRTVIGATLCEDAGHPVPQKVRPCGFGKCPQWHTTEWTPCDVSRCFNWKTAMQRRDVTCRWAEDGENDQQNATLLDHNKCDDTSKPVQKQECYNDACKGVWRVGEWSEVRPRNSFHSKFFYKETFVRFQGLVEDPQRLFYLNLYSVQRRARRMALNTESCSASGTEQRSQPGTRAGTSQDPRS